MRIGNCLYPLWSRKQSLGPVYSLTFDFCGSTNEEGFLVAAVEAGASTAAAAEWSPGFFFAIVRLMCEGWEPQPTSVWWIYFLPENSPFLPMGPQGKREARTPTTGTRLTLKIETMNQKFYIVSLFYGDTIHQQRRAFRLQCLDKYHASKCSVENKLFCYFIVTQFEERRQIDK